MTGQERQAFKANLFSSCQQEAYFHRSFVDEGILFIPFSELKESLAREVLAWRNHPEIRKWMYNKEVISEEAHFRFLQLLPHQFQRYYWLVKEGDKKLGVIDLSNYQAGESEWGFYLNPKYISGGKAFHLFHHALHFFFRQLKLQKVYGYVACQNTNSLLLNELFELNLTALLPRTHDDQRHWYAKYEIHQGEYLQRDLKFSELRKKIVKDRRSIQQARHEIRIRQLLIQAFGCPILPWTVSVLNNPSSADTFDRDNVLFAQFQQLLASQFQCDLIPEQILACKKLTDLVQLVSTFH